LSETIEPKENNPQPEFHAIVYPPKPVIIEKNDKALSRSLISLFIYAVLFYFLFDRNLVYIAAILVVIIINEMGHFLSMRFFNYSNAKIFIIPLLGALTSGKKQQVSQWQLTLIILAGPLPGIIIGSLLYWFNRDAHIENINVLAYSFLVINLLNCLPFYPLDGGRLVETLFYRDNYVIRLVFGIISIIALTVLFAISLNPIMLIIPALITFELFNENKLEKIREYLRQEKINFFTSYDSLPDKDYWLIRDCLIFSFPKKYGSIVPGKLEYNVFEPVLLRQVNSVLRVRLIADLNLPKRILILLFYIALFFTPIVFFLLLKFGQV
jgi:stage IV sporulation protein FB